MTMIFQPPPLMPHVIISNAPRMMFSSTLTNLGHDVTEVFFEGVS